MFAPNLVQPKTSRQAILALTVPMGAAREGEVARLVGLGAAVLRVRPELTLMADPEGNEFCVE
jgi:glyoxalase superfamily protein